MINMFKEISVSQFKVHYLEIIRQLQANQETIIITKRSGAGSKNSVI
jgi:hypothetical protein